MFEKMCKPRLARSLVGRPDVIPHVNRYHGGLVIFMHHDGQSIGKDESLELQVWLLRAYKG
jgi:hypothetical protein